MHAFAACIQNPVVVELLRDVKRAALTGKVCAMGTVPPNDSLIVLAALDVYGNAGPPHLVSASSPMGTELLLTSAILCADQEHASQQQASAAHCNSPSYACSQVTRRCS